MEALACLEEGYTVRRAPSDATILQDERVLANLLIAEDQHHTSLAYFKFQKEILPYMRKVVVTWLLEVCEEQHREDEVFPLTVNFLDRVLSCIQVKKTRLQLVATACLFIASKMKETAPIDAQRLVMYTDYSITVSELLDWELLILQVLRWDTSAITPHDFLHPLLVRLPIEERYHATIMRHSSTFIAMCAIDFNLAALSPSIVAASSLVASIKGLVNVLSTPEQQSCLIHRLHSITSIDTEYIRSCVGQIELVLSNNFSQSSDDTSTSITTAPTPSTPSNQKPSDSGLPSTPTDVREIMLSA